MSRYWLVLAGIVATTAVACGGCRSCSSCHDYDPPVASADCTACGCHRAGSASGATTSEGYVTEEYVVEPATDAPPSQNVNEQDPQDSADVTQPSAAR